MTGVCSYHGRPGYLVPCLERAVTGVSRQEVTDYQGFRERYDRYWSRYFDPIAIRLGIGDKQHWLETIVLPLIDNSIHTGLSRLLAGEPAPLAARQVPERTMFSLVFNWKQGSMAKANELGFVWDWLLPKARNFELEFDEQLALMAMRAGFGRELGLHVYDATPMFDLRLTEALGDLSSVGSQPSADRALDRLLTGALIASVNAPVFVDIGVHDPELVDRFLARVARQRQADRWWMNYDFAKLPLAGGKARVRCLTMNAGPLKLRVFWARIGRRLCIASRRFILDDIAKLHQAVPGTGPSNGGTSDTCRRSHALARIDALAWQRVLPSYLLGWADNHRRSCLNNLGALGSLTRPVLALHGASPEHMPALAKLSKQLYRQELLCPDGGEYVFSTDGHRVRRSIHGRTTDPRQPIAPSTQTGAGQLLGDLSGVTAELTFLEDGLRAVLTIDRR